MKGNNILKLRKGVTIVEVITSLSIMVVVVMLAVGIFSLSIQGERVTAQEFHLQRDMRMVMDQVSHRIRYSTAIFILPEVSFNNTSIDTSLEFIPYVAGGFLSAEWNYYGFIDNVVVRYIWEESPNGHRRVELFRAADSELDFDLRFAQIDPLDMSDTLVEFKFTASRDGVDDPLIDILTAADALNAMQVVDQSSGFSDVSPGRAIAYRMDELPRDNPIARVVLVLDVSGSMRWNMAGQEITGGQWSTLSRMHALREATEELIDIFAEMDTDNVYLTIIPYSQTADFGIPCSTAALGNVNNPQSGRAAMRHYKSLLFGVPWGMPGHLNNTYTFANVKDNAANFRNLSRSLFSTGGTNVGDGLRRAYFALAEAPPDPYDRDIMEFIILMTDGEPNMATMQLGTPNNWASESSNLPFFTNPGPAPNQGRNRYTGFNYNPITNVPTFGTVSTSNAIAHSEILINNSFWQEIPFLYRDIVYENMRYWATRIVGRGTNIDFIAFAATVFENDGVTPIPKMEDISNMFYLSHIYTAVNFEGLVAVFKTLANSIVLDLWHASGPNIVPPSGP